jgi:anhydro-N-acetylmuramic acid kinase
MRVAGIMSGTSLDGIDVAIVDIAGLRLKKRIDVVALDMVPYPRAVREALLAVSNTMAHTASISRLNFLLGELYAEAFLAVCRRHGIDPESVFLIGMHGQTIFHEGRPIEYLGRQVASTLQIGESAVVAERTGIYTISNFRERDIAAGGNGAPLVPYVDYLLFRDRKYGRVALNVGGIANVTAIPPRVRPDRVIAFDTGPGNMVIDALVAKLTDGARKYDKGGRIAARGRVHDRLLTSMMSDEYFRLPPPKSAGREQFGQEYVGGLIATGIPLEDLIATATSLTARSIAMAVLNFVEPHMRVDQVVVSGGGAHNRYLMRLLADLMRECEVKTSDEFGVSADGKEAIAFAILAFESFDGHAANLPSATGARHPVLLGKSTRALPTRRD